MCVAYLNILIFLKNLDFSSILLIMEGLFELQGMGAGLEPET